MIDSCTEKLYLTASRSLHSPMTRPGPKALIGRSHEGYLLCTHFTVDRTRNVVYTAVLIVSVAAQTLIGSSIHDDGLTDSLPGLPHKYFDIKLTSL